MRATCLILFEGVCVTSVILAPGACGMGSEPRVLPPLASLPRLPRRVAKTQILLLYASLQSSRGPRTLSCDAQAAELVRVPALPCTREHRKINFHQKNTYDLEEFFFRGFAGWSQTPVFYNEISASSGQVFAILASNWPNSTSGPRGASGIQCGHNLTQSGSNLIPIG